MEKTHDEKDVVLGKIDSWEMTVGDIPDTPLTEWRTTVTSTVAGELPEHVSGGIVEIFHARKWWQWIIPRRDIIVLGGDIDISEIEDMGDESSFEIKIQANSATEQQRWLWWWE